MNKFALTTEGIAQLQERLYQMDDENLKQAAVAIADDVLAWIANYFEIEVPCSRPCGKYLKIYG